MIRSSSVARQPERGQPGPRAPKLEGSAKYPVPRAALGAALVAAIDIVLVNLKSPFPTPGDRLFHAGWSLALAVATGMAFDSWDWIWGAVLRRRWGLSAARAALGSVGAWWLLGAFIVHQSHHALDGRFVTLLLVGTIAAWGVGFAACAEIGAWSARSRILLPAGVLLATAAAIANGLVLRDDYDEVHAAGAILAAVFLGHALATRLASRGPLVRRPAVALVVLCLVGLAGLIPPPNAVRLELLGSPAGVGPWLAANTLWRLPAFDGAPDPRVAAACVPLPRDAPQRPPSAERCVDGPTVVVLVTVEAFRADALLEPSAAARFPTLARMQREGVSFSVARTPGSQTAVTLSSMFAGKYFSELKWTPHGAGAKHYYYPADDPTPRFTTNLRESGVGTFKVASIDYLANEYGVAPGFETERVVSGPRKHALAGTVMAPLFARLHQVRSDESLFAYVHLTEPHEPYDRGTVRQGPPQERYLSEIEVVDRALRALLAALRVPALANRTLVVVTGDHGEAFGEHGTTFHSKTLYEELVRVPLLFWGAGVRPRAIQQPVTLIDLGPTILDWFGVPTPAWHAGQSLLPLLAGADVPLSRPILAEGRMRRSLYVGDLKVIVDLRRKTVESYDLGHDQGELDNLFDRDPHRAGPALSALSRLFAARVYTEPGYSVPYRP